MILDLESWLRENNYDIDSISDSEWEQMEEAQDELESLYLNYDEDKLFIDLLALFNVKKLQGEDE